MSDDIVVMLTHNVPCFDSRTDRPRSKPCGYDGGLCPECRKKQDAADVIEALRGENARLNALLSDNSEVIEYAKVAQAEAEALRGEVERLTVNGIHTCHDNCQRLPCVQGREIRRLKGALEAFVKHFGPLEDNVMLHKNVRECYRLAREALVGETT